MTIFRERPYMAWRRVTAPIERRNRVTKPSVPKRVRKKKVIREHIGPRIEEEHLAHLDVYPTLFAQKEEEARLAKLALEAKFSPCPSYSTPAEFDYQLESVVGVEQKDTHSGETPMARTRRKNQKTKQPVPVQLDKADVKQNQTDEAVEQVEWVNAKSVPKIQTLDESNDVDVPAPLPRLNSNSSSSDDPDIPAFDNDDPAFNESNNESNNMDEAAVNTLRMAIFKKENPYDVSLLQQEWMKESKRLRADLEEARQVAIELAKTAEAVSSAQASVAPAPSTLSPLFTSLLIYNRWLFQTGWKEKAAKSAQMGSRILAAVLTSPGSSSHASLLALSTMAARARNVLKFGVWSNHLPKLFQSNEIFTKDRHPALAAVLYTDLCTNFLKDLFDSFDTLVIFSVTTHQSLQRLALGRDFVTLFERIKNFQLFTNMASALIRRSETQSALKTTKDPTQKRALKALKLNYTLAFFRAVFDFFKAWTDYTGAHVKNKRYFTAVPSIFSPVQADCFGLIAALIDLRAKCK